MRHLCLSISSLGLFLGLIITSSSYVHPPEDAVQRQNTLMKEGVSREREMANRLLHKLMDVAYETFKEMGVSDEELREVERKRSYIQTCYFQAITCY